MLYKFSVPPWDEELKCYLTQPFYNLRFPCSNLKSAELHIFYKPCKTNFSIGSVEKTWHN